MNEATYYIILTTRHSGKGKTVRRSVVARGKEGVEVGREINRWSIKGSEIILYTLS